MPAWVGARQFMEDEDCLMYQAPAVALDEEGNVLMPVDGRARPKSKRKTGREHPLAVWIRANKMTQAQFCREHDLNESGLSGIITGRVTRPDSGFVAKLIRITGLQMGDLFDLDAMEAAFDEEVERQRQAKRPT